MSQLITGDYVIKFERKRFRVQLSARGIAICFASAQVRGGKWRCGLSLSLAAVKVKKSNSKGLAGRTASQIELSSNTNCSAKQALVLDTDF